jgi:hypothetical protein
MKYLPLIIFLLTISCKEKNTEFQKDNDPINIQESPDLSAIIEIMSEDELKEREKSKVPKVKLIRKTLLDEITGQPCDGQTLLYISQHLDSFTEEGIIKFLGTFSKECKNNAEFSEWSNELLFKVIQKNVNLYMKAWHTKGLGNLEIVLKELESPVFEFDLLTFYEIISASKAPRDLIQYHLDAILSAAENEGINIKTSTNN